MKPKKPNPLATLPLRYQKRGRHYVDTKTGATIHSDNIHKYLPKPAPDHAEILEKRWDLRMDTHEINEDGLYVRTVQGI